MVLTKIKRMKELQKIFKQIFMDPGNCTEIVFKIVQVANIIETVCLFILLLMPGQLGKQR